MLFTGRVRLFTLLFALAALLALAGCAGQDIAVQPTREGAKITPAKGAGQDLPAQPAGQAAEQKKEAGQNTPKVPRPELGVPAAEARTPAKGNKVAYLTFDDGPNSDYTERVLDILRQKKAKASFMVVGRNIRQNPTVLQRILADGHAVINHTSSHDYNIIYQSAESFIADLDECNRVITRYTGSPAMIFRAPGGPDKLNRDFTEKLRKRGYISVGWNISAVDSDPHGVSATQVYNNIAGGLERVEKLRLTPIILMHDGTQLTTTQAAPGSALAIYIQNREATLSALPKVIDHFHGKGYKFVVVDEHTPPAW